MSAKWLVVENTAKQLVQARVQRVAGEVTLRVSALCSVQTESGTCYMHEIHPPAVTMQYELFKLKMSKNVHVCMYVGFIYACDYDPCEKVNLAQF